MQIAKIKSPDYLTLPILRALDRKQKFDKTHPRGANPGGDKEKGFQKGRTLRGCEETMKQSSNLHSPWNFVENFP